MRTPTQTEIAWFAGLFDGEGCIAIHKSSRQSLGLRIVICMTHFATIQRVKELWQVGAVSKPSRKNLNKPIQSWAASTNQALYILEKTLPYLVTKNKEARIGIAFQQRLQRQHSLRRSGAGKPKPSYLQREDTELFQLLKLSRQKPELDIEAEIKNILEEKQLSLSSAFRPDKVAGAMIDALER